MQNIQCRHLQIPFQSTRILELRGGLPKISKSSCEDEKGNSLNDAQECIAADESNRTQNDEGDNRDEEQVSEEEDLVRHSIEI